MINRANKKIVRTFVLLTILILSLLLFAPYSTLAQSGSGSGVGGSGSGVGGSGSGVDNTEDPVSLKNPLTDQPDLIAFLQILLDIIMIFAVPLIVFMIIYAGFLFVMDRGSDTKLAEAKRALLYAVIGGVIILGANVILEVIQGTVDTFR